MGKKATFVLNNEIMEEAKSLVNKGLFKSMNAFVEISISDKIEKIKRDRIEKAIKDASKDPLFLSDIKEVEKDFENVDFEGEMNEL